MGQTEKNYASSNGPKRAKSRGKSSESRDKNAPPPRKTSGSLFTRVYTLIELSQTKRFLLVFITKHTKTNDTSRSLSFTQHNSYFVKNEIIILFIYLFIYLTTLGLHLVQWLLCPE